MPKLGIPCSCEAVTGIAVESTVESFELGGRPYVAFASATHLHILDLQRDGDGGAEGERQPVFSYPVFPSVQTLVSAPSVWHDTVRRCSR